VSQSADGALKQTSVSSERVNIDFESTRVTSLPFGSGNDNVEVLKVIREMRQSTR
jgi:hypothetical protein